MDKQNDTKKANVCMACECPCDMHKEHTHDEKEQKTCSMYSHEHKSDGPSDCGCKYCIRKNMKSFLNNVFTRLTPILGAGAVGVCPLCWIGSASLLTYLGLGALIPVWRWIAFGLIAFGAVGFILDWRSHKNPYPLALLLLGTALLYAGRYVFLSTWGAWQIWGPGALLIVGAVIYNKRLFRKPSSLF